MVQSQKRTNVLFFFLIKANLEQLAELRERQSNLRQDALKLQDEMTQFRINIAKEVNRVLLLHVFRQSKARQSALLQFELILASDQISAMIEKLQVYFDIKLIGSDSCIFS